MNKVDNPGSIEAKTSQPVIKQANIEDKYLSLSEINLNDDLKPDSVQAKNKFKCCFPCLFCRNKN